MSNYSPSPRRKPYFFTAGCSSTPREIVSSVLGRVDISLVDPQLYPQLFPEFEQVKLKFMDRNDQEIIQKINFCLDYMNDYPNRERINKILTKKRKSQKEENESPLNDEDAEVELQKMYENDDFTNVPNLSRDEIDQLMALIRKKRLDAAANEDFDTADSYAELSTKLQNANNESCITKMNESKNNEMEKKLEETREHYHDLKKRWCQIEKLFKENMKKELNELKEQQLLERNELEQKKDQPIPNRYKKYSNIYLHYKTQENMLVTAKHFDEAALAQKRAKEQMAKEDRTLLSKWHAKVDDELKKLDKHHQQQYSARESTLNREKQIMIRMKNKELSSLFNKIHFLEAQLDQYNNGKPAHSNSNSLNSSRSKKSNSKENTTLPKINKNSHQKAANLNDEEKKNLQIFRTRALLNKQLYCGRALLPKNKNSSTYNKNQLQNNSKAENNP